MAMAEAELKQAVRTVRDWPIAGVNFRDVTTLFQNPTVYRAIIAALAERATGADVIAGVDARGFVLAGAVADRLGKPLALVRKAGKLPWQTVREAYELEYGQAEIELHADACQPGQNVVILDDLIATGGTLLAAASLFRRLGAGSITVQAVIDLPELGGHARLEAAGLAVHALCSFSEAE